MQIDINQHIEFRAKRDGRERPFIKDTRVEVSFIVTDSERHGMSAEEIASGYDNVSLADVYAALTFYHDNRDELRRLMREDEQFIEQLRKGNTATEQGSHESSSSVAR